MKIDFARSPRSTVGIEWEVALVERSTGDLINVADDVLAALHGPDGAEHPQITGEFLLNTVELVSKVHHRVGDAVTDLEEQLAEVRSITDPLDVELMCAGTHPFAQWFDQRVTGSERYQRMVERTQWWGRNLLIWGVHVHVGIEDVRKVIPLLNGLLRYYPHLQALSASSPYWAGVDTGYASNRALMFQQLPTAGLPFPVETWQDYEQFIGDMRGTGSIHDHTEVHWDVRPSPHWGTLEMRACDGLSTTHEVGAVAALVHCLVESMSEQLDRGSIPATLPPWFVRENKWRAARYALDAEIIVDKHGDRRRVSEAILELVEDLRPTAERLGCERELATIEQIMIVGAGYQRQRRVAAENGGSLQAVVSALTHELRHGLV